MRERSCERKVDEISAQERGFVPNFRMLRTVAFVQDFQNAPHGSAIFFNIFRMLRTGAQFVDARKRDIILNFRDAPHRSAIFFKNFRMLCTGARFWFDKRLLLTDYRGTPFKNTILNKEVDGIFRILRTGAQFSIKNHQNVPDAPHGSVIFG